MYTKDVNDRSPLRVFEKSIHGGLGKGNLGIVMSRAGVGKTACLIGIALDDLMRGRRVIHFSLHDSVDRVREFYDGLFEDLRRTVNLDDALNTHLKVERSRLIHTFRGNTFSVQRLQEDISFYKTHAHFQPEAIILDGFDFVNASETDMAALKEIAKNENVELWLSALTHRDEPITNPKGIPNPVARFEAWVAVMVQLEPQDGAISLRLLKDHENTDTSNLHLRLDPRTLLLKED